MRAKAVVFFTALVMGVLGGVSGGAWAQEKSACRLSLAEWGMMGAFFISEATWAREGAGESVFFPGEKNIGGAVDRTAAEIKSVDGKGGQVSDTAKQLLQLGLGYAAAFDNVAQCQDKAAFTQEEIEVCALYIIDAISANDGNIVGIAAPHLTQNRIQSLSERLKVCGWE